MKKILLTAAATTVLASSSAMANMQGDFYGTLYGGMNKLNKVKLVGDKHKSETAGHIGLGVGYYINEMFRTDLTFDHLFDPEFKYSGKDEENHNESSKITGEVNALMLNAYADLFDAGMAKFYAGVGAGAARVKAKASYTGVTSFDVIDGQETNLKTSTIKTSTQDQTNFVYALHVGASSEFAPGVNGFIQYSWKDYGKSSKKIKGSKEKADSVKFRGHHGSIGVRVDF